jgi:pyrroline-5-carboxylate reductase
MRVAIEIIGYWEEDLRMRYELGILGAGNMAEAIVRSLINSERMTQSQIAVADIVQQRREIFERDLGVCTFADNIRVVENAKTVLLSVKPQQIKTVLAEIARDIVEQTLVISIAAGISTLSIESGLGNRAKWRVIRAMPNTPMLVGVGMVAVTPGNYATPNDLAVAKGIFDPSAIVLEVEEAKMDAVTALSGSGPAYFFYLVEQMIHAGQNLGLTLEQAQLLATRTALGAATMLIQSQQTPLELRRKVTSPGGTTQAAMNIMETNGVGSTIVSAIERAAARSRELGG